MPLRRACLLILLLAGIGNRTATAQVPGPVSPITVLPNGPNGPAAPGLPQPAGPDRPSALPPPALPPSAGPAPTAATCCPSEPTPENRRFALLGSWEDGLRFSSADGWFHIHVGGNAQVDSTWLIGPNAAFTTPSGSISGIGNASATFLRRVRLRFDGDIFDQFDYVVEYDLANANNENDGIQPPSFGNLAGSPAPANIWMQVRDVPFFGNVRFGNQVKPIGMTNNTNQAVLPFMERADNMDAFYGPFDGGFALGLAARNHTDNERVTWQYGIYRPSINVFGVGLNKFEWGGRVTGLPVYQDDGRVLVHLGLGTLNGELPQNELRARARPLLRNGPGFANPILVDTGGIGGSRQYTIAPEFAAVFGPWTFQAEWTGQWLTQATPVGGTNQGTVLFHGGYAEVLYFLTGEYQPYNKEDGAFGRVIPLRNLRFKRGEGCTGCGAWQVGLRFSYLDLNDRAIQGGTVYDWTAGLNWFWNPNMKVQFNAILERRDQPGVAPAWIGGFGVRGAYDF
jgi:phosphate-selective porin OprO and OprP